MRSWWQLCIHFQMSKVSFSILEILEYMCCSLLVYASPLKSCMAILYSKLIGADIVHNARWSSVILLPWIKPPDVLNDLLSACSITRSQSIPIQKWFISQMTCNQSILKHSVDFSFIALQFTHFLEVQICWFQIAVVSCCCKYRQCIVNRMQKINPRCSMVSYYQQSCNT